MWYCEIRLWEMVRVRGVCGVNETGATVCGMRYCGRRLRV